MGYPVLAEKSLPPARRRLLLGGRREAADLPPLPPGAVYVFKSNGGYQEYLDQRHLDVSDQIVVDAVAVSVVQMRPSMVATDIAIPSANPADDFTVRASFRCRVNRADVVANAGLMDLEYVLGNHLRQDRDLSSLGVEYHIEDVNTVRQLADSQINAYCTLVPPEIPGMEVDFASVTVLAPTDLREHGRRLRDTKWNNDIRTLEAEYENDDVKRIVEILSAGPAAVDAFGIVRGQVNVSDVSIRTHEEEQQRRKQLGEVVQVMVDRGFFDRVPIDPVRLMDALAGGATGVTAAEALHAPAAPAAVGGSQPRLGDRDSDSDDEGPDFIPNEEDVD